MKILAVDDDKVFMDLLVPVLRSLGEDDVKIALSAAEALAQIAHSPQAFDCILLDIQMPGTSGVQLCRSIRNLTGYKRTPIIMITSMSTKSFIDEAFSAGATDYVIKPIDRLDIRARLGMVQRLLNERRIAEDMARQIAQRSNIVTVDVDFETKFMIPGFARGMEYLALENYLLTLGPKRLFAMTALCVHVQNAEVILRRGNPTLFVAMLSDVASVLEDVFKTANMMIAYAGRGDFVGVAGSAPNWDTDDLQQMINAGIAEFESIYASERLPLPLVKVGLAVKSSFLASFKPTFILKRSIELARGGRDYKASFPSMAS